MNVRAATEGQLGCLFWCFPEAEHLDNTTAHTENKPCIESSLGNMPEWTDLSSENKCSSMFDGIVINGLIFMLLECYRPYKNVHFFPPIIFLHQLTPKNFFESHILLFFWLIRSFGRYCSNDMLFLPL